MGKNEEVEKEMIKEANREMRMRESTMVVQAKELLRQEGYKDLAAKSIYDVCDMMVVHLVKHEESVGSTCNCYTNMMLAIDFTVSYILGPMLQVMFKANVTLTDDQVYDEMCKAMDAIYAERAAADEDSDLSEEDLERLRLEMLNRGGSVHTNSNDEVIN